MKLIKSLIIVTILLIFSIAIIFLKINNFTLSQEYEDCKIIYNNISERNVILRIDDVRSDIRQNVEKKMIEDAKKRNIPLVLGLIPSKFDVNSEIGKIVMDSRCHNEIALHGYEHSSKEFENLSYSDAFLKIKKGIETFKKFNYNAVTFIPPNSIISEDSEKALKDLGFRIISGENKRSGHGYLPNYGFTQTTYFFKEEILVDYKEIINGCENTLKKQNNCVIVMHPQDFVTDGKIDQGKYNNYLNLLGSLKDLDIKLINFRDIEKSSAIRL